MLSKERKNSMNNTSNNVNSTFPKTQKKLIYVELNIYQRFCHNLFLQLLSHEANYSIFLDIGQLTVHSYPRARTAYPAPPWR